MVNKKVYCKNCKYFKNVKGHIYYGVNTYPAECTFKIFSRIKTTKDEITGRVTREKMYKSARSIAGYRVIDNKYHIVLNKHNKCKYYKKRWWILDV